MTNPVTVIEDEIVAQLKDNLPRTVTRIDSFPDNPEKYDFPERDTAAVFVHLSEGKYAGAAGRPQQAYAPARTLTWEIVLLVRSLRGADGGRIGAYPLLHDVRIALQGRSFGGATAMVPVSERLQEQKGGIWRWGMTFTNSIPAVAVVDYGDRPPLMSGFTEDHA